MHFVESLSIDADSAQKGGKCLRFCLVANGGSRSKSQAIHVLWRTGLLQNRTQYVPAIGDRIGAVPIEPKQGQGL